MANKLKLFFLSLLISNNIIADGYQPTLPPDNCFYQKLNRWKEFSTVFGYMVWPLYEIENITRKIMYLIDLSKDRKYINNLNKKKELLFKKYYCKINEFNDVSKNIATLDESLNKIVGQKDQKIIIRETMVSLIQKFYEFDYFKKENEKNFKEQYKKLEEELKSKKLKKKQIRLELEDFKNTYEYENSKYYKNGPGCTFMYFVGPAGTGKTETALSIVSSISANKKPAFVIDASTILKAGGKFSTLFKDIEIKKERNVYYLKSDLDTYIRTTKRGVIVFNEIDKILKNPALADDLNETLRTLKDNNYYINDSGEQVDVSGFVFIFTSNEKINKKEQDNTGSMTDVFFDQSLRTRFRIIKFDKFKIEDYQELIRRYFEDVKKSFLEIYKDFNIELLFEKDIEKYCSEYIYNDEDLQNRGARAIYDVLGDNLKSNLFLLLETLKSKESLKDKKVYISFDDEKNIFVVNETSFIKHKIREKVKEKENVKKDNVKKEEPRTEEQKLEEKKKEWQESIFQKLKNLLFS